jgi:hypothetical protein
MIVLTEEYLKQKEEEDKKYIELAGYMDNSIDLQQSVEVRKDLFEFDIEFNVKELMKRYLTKINLIYSVSDIENIRPKQIMG